MRWKITSYHVPLECFLSLILENSKTLVRQHGNQWSNLRKTKFQQSARKKEGALDRARTDDLRLIRATRYQLRYESCAQMVTSQ
jgi:hypothetical protein